MESPKKSVFVPFPLFPTPWHSSPMYILLVFLYCCFGVSENYWWACQLRTKILSPHGLCTLLAPVPPAGLAWLASKTFPWFSPAINHTQSHQLVWAIFISRQVLTSPPQNKSSTANIRKLHCNNYWKCFEMCFFKSGMQHRKLLPSRDNSRKVAMRLFKNCVARFEKLRCDGQTVVLHGKWCFPATFLRVSSAPCLGIRFSDLLILTTHMLWILWAWYKHQRGQELYWGVQSVRCTEVCCTV